MIHSVLEQTEPALLVHLPKQAPIQIFRAVQGATVDPTSEGLRCFCYAGNTYKRRRGLRPS